MKTLLNSELFILTLNLGIYAFAFYIIKYLKIKYLNILILGVPLIVLFLYIFDISLEAYQEGSRFLNFLLGPSVVALGYLIHKNIKTIGKAIIPLFFCVSIGAFVNSMVINIVMNMFNVDMQIINSLHPKSVTTPIAYALSNNLGGIASLTVMSVVFTGIFGYIVGVPLLDIFKVKSRIARGAALGASAHAIGTSKAIELGELEGAVSSFTIGLMGVITAILLPYINTCFL